MTNTKLFVSISVGKEKFFPFNFDKVENRSKWGREKRGAEQPWNLALQEGGYDDQKDIHTDSVACGDIRVCWAGIVASSEFVGFSKRCH